MTNYNLIFDQSSNALLTLLYMSSIKTFDPLHPHITLLQHEHTHTHIHTDAQHTHIYTRMLVITRTHSDMHLCIISLKQLQHTKSCMHK